MFGIEMLKYTIVYGYGRPYLSRHLPKWSSQTNIVPSSMPKASIFPFSDTQLLVMPMGSSQPFEGEQRTTDILRVA